MQPGLTRTAALGIRLRIRADPCLQYAIVPPLRLGIQLSPIPAVYQSLPVTLLLGGPLEGMRWAVDNAAVPLLRFDVPTGGYVRYVAMRPVPIIDPVPARVFYVYEELSAERIDALIALYWQDGAPLISDPREQP